MGYEFSEGTVGAVLRCSMQFQASAGDLTARSSNGFFIHLAEPGLERLKAGLHWNIKQST